MTHHTNKLYNTYYVSTRNLQKIIGGKIFYVLIIWDLCTKNIFKLLSNKKVSVVEKLAERQV